MSRKFVIKLQSHAQFVNLTGMEDQGRQHGHAKSGQHPTNIGAMLTKLDWYRVTRKIVDSKTVDSQFVDNQLVDIKAANSLIVIP